MLDGIEKVTYINNAGVTTVNFIFSELVKLNKIITIPVYGYHNIAGTKIISFSLYTIKDTITGRHYNDKLSGYQFIDTNFNETTQSVLEERKVITINKIIITPNIKNLQLRYYDNLDALSSVYQSIVNNLQANAFISSRYISKDEILNLNPHQLIAEF